VDEGLSMPDAFLERKERTKLIGIVSKLDEFGDSISRRNFVRYSAQLGRFDDSIVWEGTGRGVAGTLIGKLEEFGRLPEHPAYHALGALLIPLLELGDVNDQDKTFIADLISRYSLIDDPDLIGELRTQYNLPDDVAPKPALEVRPPINRSKLSPGPEFEIAIDDEAGLESVINSEDNFLDIHLMYGAIYCHQAVGHIEIPKGTAQGTGFLVGPDLLLTNKHVIEEQKYLEDAVVHFNFLKDHFSVSPKGRYVSCQPDFYKSSPVKELDYALIRLAECPLKDKSKDFANLKEEDKSIPNLVHNGQHRGYLTLASHNIMRNQRVNIIQHPRGQAMKVVMTQNYVVGVHKNGTHVNYIADTDNGSSGSPVFNQQWEVVALHRSGKPYPDESLSDTLKRLSKGKWKANHGITLRALIDDFKKNEIYSCLPK